MNEKEVWISPKVEMIEISVNDVIATSGEETSNYFTLDDITNGGEF